MTCAVCGEHAPWKYRVVVECHGPDGLEDYEADTQAVPLCDRHRDQVIGNVRAEWEKLLAAQGSNT